jgi:hypothetical protein
MLDLMTEGSTRVDFVPDCGFVYADFNGRRGVRVILSLGEATAIAKGLAKEKPEAAAFLFEAIKLSRKQRRDSKKMAKQPPIENVAKDISDDCPF